jgi:hypothetical protein
MAARVSKENNKWYQSVWLPFAAGTYIIICIFDFMVMPVYVAAHNSKIEARVFAQLEGKDIATFATAISQTAQATKQWNPLTLLGAGMFHMAFGALLTGGAVTRGLAKKSEMEGYYRYGAAGYEDDEVGYSRSDEYGENAPYRPNRPGMYNRYRNPRVNEPESTATDSPMPKTDGLDGDIK